jgi:uncharacterized protein (DUF362 family)
MSSVVVVKYSDGQRSGSFDTQIYQTLLSTGLTLLGGTKDISEAVHKFLPVGVIGMKTNCLTRKMNSTPVALVDALCNILEKSGYDSNELVVWDRSNRELSSAGYTLNASGKGRLCFGTDANSVGYSETFYTSGEVNSLVSQIMTRLVDFNINLPILKDHSFAGMSGGLKNMYGAINNPNKFHADNCDPFCAHVSNLDPIKKKNKLTILDAVNVQYQGGPGFIADFFAPYHGIVISSDPIAADRVGLEVLENLRKMHDQPSLEKAGRPVKYLNSAEKLGLGVATLDQINLKVVSVDADGRAKQVELF